MKASQQVHRDKIAQSLDAAEKILVVGPSTTKLEFVKHLHEHGHARGPRTVGIETVDRPTDRQLVYAKKYFGRVDQMR